LKDSYKKLEETFEELTASEEELRNQYEKIEEHAKNIEMLKEKYEHLAHHDFLTNLPNRFKFMNHLDDIMSQYRPGAILLLDIDNFKEVNDTMGHLYGDELLKEFATRLERVSDEHFFASRFGGDEFIILLSDLREMSEVEEYIYRIKTALEDAFLLENKENHLEYSMGVTRFPFDSNDANELLMYADTALYQVKQAGKNSCLFYNNAMQENLKDKTEIDTILRQAIKEDGFKLVYQPQVSVETGEIVGFEALIRLKEHKISPGKFISIAEENGLINKIGRWVTKEVIHQLAEWKKSGMNLKPVAFNFSSKQIQDKSYLEYLKNLLEEYEVSTEFIEIEITESILLENSDETYAFLNQLKEIGIKIALDDFGTGYSSLNYLAYIPVNKVKLDKSLIDKFLNLDNSAVISSIISLAHSLNLSIIAEGIEMLEQYNLLKTEGCDYIQGYLFSMPLSVDETERIYNANLVNVIIKDYKNNSD
jgi:diguanylate cyclase (GGDEF)-like protein